MEKNTLSKDINLLEKEIKKKSKKVLEYRKLSFLYLVANGWSIKNAAEVYHFHLSSAYDILKKWEKEKKIEDKRGGSQSFLSQEQSQQLITHLSSHIYVNVKPIIEFTYKNFGVCYTTSGMTKWLKHHGFRYKKPKGVPAKADKFKQEKFREFYEKNLKNTEEAVYFMDASHPTMATKKAFGWIQKGKNKVLPDTANRYRVNIVGAVDIKTKKIVHHFYQTVNSDSIILFLKDLLKKDKELHQQQRKIHIVLDQGRYHCSKKTLEFVDAQQQLVLHFLPAYSPNLNPIERLWKILNEQVRNNVYFQNQKNFKEAIEGFFVKTIPKIHHILDSRITDNFQTLPIKT